MLLPSALTVITYLHTSMLHRPFYCRNYRPHTLLVFFPLSSSAVGLTQRRYAQSAWQRWWYRQQRCIVETTLNTFKATRVKYDQNVTIKFQYMWLVVSLIVGGLAGVVTLYQRSPLTRQAATRLRSSSLSNSSQMFQSDGCSHELVTGKWSMNDDTESESETGLILKTTEIQCGW